MKKLKIIFMGTTDFGVPALEKLVENGHEVLGVVAQPDRPNQRGKKISFLPLKAKAIALGIEVLQPDRIKDEQFVEKLKTFSADVFIVAAYGQLLSEEILFMPKFGSLNLHGSLLPKYRGAAPIQRAIINGECQTGVTIMKMNIGMDTGEMLSKVEVPITDQTTFGELYHLLSELGADLLIETLSKLETIHPEIQNDSLATYAEKINKETGHIVWNKDGKTILSLLNGLDPHPGGFSFYKESKIKCFKPEITHSNASALPGTILTANPTEGLIIKTGDGAIKILEIQFPGKKRMEAKAFLRGKQLEEGYILK
ncbi:MAG: methionyl-tRNA formyltransferase [Eubacteriaceae bacterium]